VGETSFLVEEFIDSITSQLDRVQDALRIKAVNRPLTYALKDLSLELKVFVELDAQGRVRFRTSGANEPGASIVNLGFTTITKPMIEENTISLAASRSPSLQEAGFGDEDRRNLERYGVRTVSELQKLDSSAGTGAISRLSAIPTDRLKAALSLGRPQVKTVTPVAPKPVAPPRPAVPAKPVPPRTFVPPGTRKLEISGRNLVGENGPPVVTLKGRPLSVEEADDDRLIVGIPDDGMSGALEVEMPDGTITTYELALGGDNDYTDEWGTP